MSSRINQLLTYAFWIACLIFTTTASVHSDEKPTVYNITPPPSCVNNIGESVIFENVENGRGENAAGMAKRDETGTPVVYRFNYKNSPQPLK